MNDEQEKAKLWNNYKILLGIMLGGTVLVLGGQQVWSTIQQNSANTINNKSSSTTTTSTPNSSLQQTQPSTSNSFTKQDAVNLINRYLQAKDKIFAPPFDRQLVANFTTGKLYYDITKPESSVDWLQKNNAYYKYGIRKAEPIEYFSTTGNLAQIDVLVTEEVSYYQNGKIELDKTNSDKYRYTLQQEKGTWKIADYTKDN
ncbi:MAG: ARC6/PARC6 family protein [Coleofasciculaceae cyanobacterium]